MPVTVMTVTEDNLTPDQGQGLWQKIYFNGGEKFAEMLTTSPIELEHVYNVQLH